jgi:hypothetical protein
MLKKIIIGFIAGFIILNFAYKSYTANNYEKDFIKWMFETAILYAYTGGGLFLLVKLAFLKNYKWAFSELMFILFSHIMENNKIFANIENFFSSVYSLGHISGKRGRVLLFKEILTLENVHIIIFICNAIYLIIHSDSRNDQTTVIKIFKESFKEYNEELISLMQSESFPDVIIDVYLQFKKSYIDTFNDYLDYKLEQSNTDSIPCFFIALSIIDVLSTSTINFLKQLHYEVDHLNGNLNGQLFRGHLL